MNTKPASAALAGQCGCVYQWWLARSNAQVSVSYATNGYQMTTTISVSGATDTNTSVELLAPGTNSFCAIQVLTNGVAGGGNSYRINGQLLKLRVGTSVTNAVISFYPAGPPTQIFREAFDSVSAPNLPAGWTTSASNAQSGWITTNTAIDTAPYAAFSPDPTNIESTNGIAHDLNAVGQPWSCSEQL